LISATTAGAPRGLGVDCHRQQRLECAHGDEGAQRQFAFGKIGAAQGEQAAHALDETRHGVPVATAANSGIVLRSFEEGRKALPFQLEVENRPMMRSSSSASCSFRGVLREDLGPHAADVGLVVLGQAPCDLVLVRKELIERARRDSGLHGDRVRRGLLVARFRRRRRPRPPESRRCAFSPRA